ncbi:MAG: hypothetical protein V3S30_03830, partial [Thermoanaerobaculia bacterium]
GLGDATAIRKLEVFWPASEMLQAFDDVQVDGFYSLEEGGALQSLSALLPPENANPKPGTSSASTTSAGGGL